MRPRALPPAMLAAALLGASLAAACGRSDPPAGADSALARDLTLANGTTRPPLSDSLTLGGDTATARPSAAITPPPAAAPAPSRTAPPAHVPSTTARASAARASAAPRHTVAVRRAPAPAPVPAEPAAAASPAATPAAARTASGDAGAGAGRSLATGTLLAGTLGQRVCTESNRPGDRFVATLGSDVSGPSGVVLPAGTPLVLEVARVAGDPPAAEFVVRGVSINGDFVPIAADANPVTGSTERHQIIDKASDKGKAVQGAIAGAILGQILGRSTKGTIIGAAGGAAAGAAMGRGKSHEETCVASGAAVRVRLTEPFSVR